MPILALALAAVSFTSCGDDKDEPEIKEENIKADEETSQAAMFIGTWYNSVSYGGVYWTFNADGTCHSSIGGYDNHGTWSYAEDAKILTTTVQGGVNNWAIISVSENSWTGMILSATGSTFTYVRVE